MAEIDVKKMTCHLFREDPVIEERIRNGIESNRKGGAEIVLLRKDGGVLENAEIRYTQLSHEYFFGCNAFLLEQFPEDERNERHNELFANLFNLAVVPFYWKDLEPEKGRLRFDRNSPEIYRRPPPEAVLDFCGRYGIVPKGHVLSWHHPGSLPAWLPKEPDQIAREMERRFREIAERFGSRIPFWDVANEAVGYRGVPAMPKDYVRFAFELADRYFPKTAKLIYNDNNWSWFSDYTPLYLLLRHLQAQGCRLDRLGLQYHMFGSGRTAESWADDMLNPEYMFKVLDLDASVGVPLQISEVTILGSDELGDGEEVQSRILDRMYRLWFSHPATEAIIYWNLIDDCALSRKGWDENYFKGGLVHFDMTPKKAYGVLESLIRKEWHTEGILRYDSRKANRFRGFYGRYKLEIRTDSFEMSGEINLSRNGLNRFEIAL